MSTQGPSPLPPTTILSTKPISQSAAHDFLAAYLDRANTDPALQPNAVITERGPVSRTTAAAPNLILHNLKRVQAGLAGEVLGRDLSFAKLSADTQAEEADATAEGWVDKEKWQQEDEEEAPGGDEDYFQEEDEDLETQETQALAVDKEERKRKKKERRLAEKRAKAKGAEDEE